MEIKFNIDKNERKALAQKIAELTETEMHYCGVPSCAYQIGSYTVSKEAVLLIGDDVDGEQVNTLLADLAEAGYTAEPEPESLTITMPRDFFTDDTLDNLRKIVENKAALLRHSLGTDDLTITETEEAVEFPWFTLKEPDDGEAYSQFISMLCDFAKERKRVVNKPDTSDNEKFAFRCFLIRLGMIGADYKHTRKVLLRNLTGSSAFRHGKPDTTEGGADDAVSD